MRADLREARAGAVCGGAEGLLALLRGRLDEAHGAGEPALKLGPDDLRGLCSRAGIEGDAVGAFRLLVRTNLVRLRGRWREGVSGRTAPVYVSRIVESGDAGRGTGFGEDERSGAERRPSGGTGER